MKRYYRFFILSGILLVSHFSSSYAQDRPPARVGVSSVRFQELAQEHSFIGTLYYERISHVSSEVAGLVTKISVRAGDQVKKGIPLIHLDTQILEKEIVIHKKQIEQADLRIDHAQKNYQRMDALYRKGGTSEKNYDDARFSYEEFVLKKASEQAVLEKLLIHKEKSTIPAPFDGVVLEKKVDRGDWVHQGKTLVQIGSIHDLFIKLPVAETLLTRIQTGQKVNVVIHSHDQTLTGTIERLFPSADTKTKNIFLKIRIPYLSYAVQNMSATVSIPLGEKKKLAIVPRDSLTKVNGNDVVFMVKEGKAVMRPVTIVAFQGDSVGVEKQDFTEETQVVVDGNERLQPDQPVVVAGD